MFHRYGRPIKSTASRVDDGVQEGGPPRIPAPRSPALGRADLERSGVSPSVAMRLTGHKTEAVYRRYAIVAENDLREAGAKLAATLGARAQTGSFGDNPGDNSVTARKR